MGDSDRERLPGQSLAHDERLLRARIGFLAPFYRDPRVAAFITDLDQHTGLLAAADRFAPLGTALAKRIGLRHRSALWLTPPEQLAAAIDALPVTSDYQTLFEATMAAREAAIETHQRLTMR